jgi:hypothetical protein
MPPRRSTASSGGVLVVNMIPRGMSDDEGQDSEPSIAVNPKNPRTIAASAFTKSPTGGDLAPIYVSSDGGKTWTLSFIVPSQAETWDISIAYATSGRRLYAGILRVPPGPGDETRLNILRTTDPTKATTMTALVDRLGPDQPSLYCITAAKRDRVYVGQNVIEDSTTKSSLVEVSQSGGAKKAKFKQCRVEVRASADQNGPQVRVAGHPDGKVYATYYGWRNQDTRNRKRTIVTADVVVVRDDKHGNSKKPFAALVDPADNLSGRIVAKGVKFAWDEPNSSPEGQQRMGGDLSIAVDPGHSGNVFLAWGANDAAEYGLHLARSTDSGATWTKMRTVPRATNPGLAVNSAGTLGFVYQVLAGSGAALRWVTHFERSTNGSSWTDLVLSTAPANSPKVDYDPYLGDYLGLQAIKKDFYGVFSASNVPDNANFPSGVVYQRNADFQTKRLLGVDGTSVVKPSIDPFFFSTRS